MQLGEIDDHARFTVISHLVECKRAADHVAGEALTSFGIGGLAADAVVHGEARASPLAYAMGESVSRAPSSHRKLSTLWRIGSQRAASGSGGNTRNVQDGKKHAIGY